MSKGSRLLLVCGIIAFSTLALFSINLLSNQISSNSVSLSTNGASKYTGDYDGNMSIVYFTQNWNGSDWSNENRSTYLIRQGQTQGSYNFSLNRLNIRADDLLNGTGN
jgi:hypothetical protein